MQLAPRRFDGVAAASADEHVGACGQVGVRDRKSESLAAAGDEGASTRERVPHGCLRPTEKYLIRGSAPSDCRRKLPASTTTGCAISRYISSAFTSRSMGHGVATT